jgi:plastocyanin
MNSKLFRVVGMILVVLALGSILLAACSRPGVNVGNNGGNLGTTPTSGGSANGCATGTVHTLATTFQESCVNVAKGSSLMVVPAATSFHILANGSWVGTNQQPANEPGAPKVNNVQVTASPVQIGPFTTAGTFHIYCTVHPGMNLTVNVM